MPNDSIKPKGPYELTWRSRRLEERRKNWNFHQNMRQRRKNPKCNPERFLKVFSYLLVFYLCIAIFSILYYKILVTYRISNNHPSKLKGVSLASVPGTFTGNIKVIRYKEFQLRATTPYVSQIYNFVNKFGIRGLHYLQACNLDNNWGYLFNQPCVMLKLNLANNFNADTYADAEDLPDLAPNELYDYLMESSSDMRSNRIWLSCNFENKTLTQAKIKYIPDRSYDAQGLFAEKNIFSETIFEGITAETKVEQPALRRIIGVQFNNLPINRDVYVRCAIYARNIRMEHASVILLLHIEGTEVVQIIEDND